MQLHSSKSSRTSFQLHQWFLNSDFHHFCFPIIYILEDKAVRCLRDHLKDFYAKAALASVSHWGEISYRWGITSALIQLNSSGPIFITRFICLALSTCLSSSFNHKLSA